jgi:hypothetical protein
METGKPTMGTIRLVGDPIHPRGYSWDKCLWESNSMNDTETKPHSKELTLRLYQPRDITRMVDILLQYIPTLPNYSMITPDRDRITYVLQHNVQNANAFCCWVLCDSHDVVQGGGAGFTIMSLLSKDFISDDVFMFVMPEFRTLRNVNMLIEAYKDWAISHGATLIRASHTGGSFREGSKEQKLYDELLRRQGFHPVGTVYHLNIE